MSVAVAHPNMTRSSLNISVFLILFLLGKPFTSTSESSNPSTQLSQDLDDSFHDQLQSDDVLSVIDEAVDSYKLDDGLDSLTSLAEVPRELRRSARQYHVAPGGYGASLPFVDFSPLFIALIPIALFLGAAAAFALSVATSSSTAVATAQQQQQQQEENNNNNNAANSNNNNNAMLAAMFASFYNNVNSRTPTFIIVNNATSLANLFGLTTLGRSMDNGIDWNQSFGRWWRQRKRRRRHKRTVRQTNA